MSNSFSYEFDKDEEFSESEEEFEQALNAYKLQYANAFGDMVNQFFSEHRVALSRRRPDLRYFRNTSLYKEIKAVCGMPATCYTPNDKWSLTRALMKRESGFSSAGNFTPNQHRHITNMFVPNHKEKRLMSLESKIFICKFNKEGSKLITACQDAMIRIFDSSKGTYHRINRMKAKDVNWSILDIDFSPCGKYFAYSTWSSYLYVVPCDGKPEDFNWLDLDISPNRSGIFSLRFSSCGRSLIAGCNNSYIYNCDRETHTKNQIKTEQNNVDINAVSFVSDTDSNVFISGCNTGKLKLWDTRCLGTNACATPVGTFIGHWDGVTYIDPRNDGYYVISNSKDQTIKLWDLRKPSPSGTLFFREGGDWDYRWDMVPRTFTDYDPTLTQKGNASIMTYRGHRVTKTLLRAKFSPALQTGQRYIYTGCATGRIIIYDVLTGYIKEAIESHRNIVRDLAWHPVRSEIVSSSWDSHVYLNTFKRNLLLERKNFVYQKR